MLADVRPMCVDGRRVPRERLKIMQPIRGELSVALRCDPWANEWVPIAVLRHNNGDTDRPADAITPDAGAHHAASRVLSV